MMATYKFMSNICVICNCLYVRNPEANFKINTQPDRGHADLVTQLFPVDLENAKCDFFSIL